VTSPTDRPARARSRWRGLIGALVGAAVWAAITIGTDYEIGYVAVLVGFLAGAAVKIGGRGRHGPVLQVAAVICAVAGVAIAKYSIFAHEFVEFVEEEYQQTISYLDPQIPEAMVEYSADLFGMFDLLWIVLAVTAAWRVPATPSLQATPS